MIVCDKFMERKDLKVVREDLEESKTGGDENISIACTPVGWRVYMS